ncbi:uncharacterized protein LOC129884183 [Solanum dulcamara]|uniref:uncharacterized protein LOC129884183 n=1 Tax=Solanum dulcamara TaxID=45834 RepID=UPI0024862D33|nr:uncharacterized protein LOC129884183 [Solanum dulcamara]
MARGRGREALPEVDVGTPTRGRGRGRTRGHGRGAAPARGRAREASLEPQIDGFNQSVRVNGTPEGSQTRAGAQTPWQHQIPIVQGSVDQPPAGPRADEDVVQVEGAQVAPVLILTDDEQRRYERF